MQEMLAEQAAGVKEVADYVSQLRRVGKGHGVYHWDKDIMTRYKLASSNGRVQISA